MLGEDPGEAKKGAAARAGVFAWVDSLRRDFEANATDGKTGLTAGRLKALQRTLPRASFHSGGYSSARHFDALKLPLEAVGKSSGACDAYLGAALNKDENAMAAARVVDVMRQLSSLLHALRKLELAEVDPDVVVPGWSFDVGPATKGEDGEVIAGRRVLQFRFKAEFDEAWAGARVLHLDATSRPAMLSALWDGPPNVIDARAREEAVVRHVRYCRSGKGVSPADGAAYVDLWARRMARLGEVGVVCDLAWEKALDKADQAAWRRLVAASTDPAVVELWGELTAAEAERKAASLPSEKKAAADAASDLTARLKRIIPPPVRPYGVLHHGGGRGRNDLERVRVLGVWGRSLISPDEIAAIATAATGDVVEAVRLEKLPAFWRLRDGSLVEGKRWGSRQGQLCDELVRHGGEDSVVQADARLRGVQRTPSTPGTAFLHVDAVIEGVVIDTAPEGLAADGNKLPLTTATMVADFVRVALGELGITPVGNLGARVWRALLSVATADGALADVGGDEWWRLRRDCQIGGACLGDVLDFAEAWAKGDARADKGLPVVRVQIGDKGCVVICRTPAAVEAVCRLGAGEVLRGRARKEALRDE